MIEIRHLRKEYENATPLKDVSVTINERDVISVIGPSGTGKSTLIRMLNRLETPTSGEIYLDGENIMDPKYDLTLLRRKVGMVFQNFNLFPQMTVVENCMIGQIKLLKKSKQEAYDKAMELLGSVGLADKALNYPDDLSGGQKQRVAIARTLSMEPKMILFDEPTSALDPIMVGEVQSVIRSLAKAGHTMMIVTHEMKFAREVSNRVFYMDEGGIYEDGTPEQIFEHPQKERTRIFVNSIRIFEEIITSKSFDFIRINTLLEEFGRRSEMDQKTIYRLQSVFEELCVTTLLPSLADDFILKISVEHSSTGGHTTMIFRYNGQRVDPMPAMNELSAKIVSAAAADVSYDFTESEEIGNCVSLIIA